MYLWTDRTFSNFHSWLRQPLVEITKKSDLFTRTIKIPDCFSNRPISYTNFTHSSARFLFLSFVHSLLSSFATKWLGEGQDVFVLLRERETYLLDVHKPFLYAVFRIRKRWECSGLESRQCGGVLRGMFLRENDKINESWRNQRKERTRRGTVMFLWLSNYSRQAKLKNDLLLFNAKCIWSRLLRLVDSPFPHVQFVFPTFFPPFCSAITTIAIISLFFTIRFDLMRFEACINCRT